MPDYSKGKIYTIRKRGDDTKIYVGSTIQSLAVRFGGHKRDSKREKCMNTKLYIEVNNDWSNWFIELYENFPCSCREELCKKEGEVIRLIGNLNAKIAGRDKKEYYLDNIEKLKKRTKQYKIENAEKLKQYKVENANKIKEDKKQYYIENAEKFKQYYIKNADKIKQYQIENADKIKEKRRLSYLKKKEEKLKKLSEATA